MKKLQDFNFKGKNVLIRCDFNVPLSKEGKVLDDFRIRKALPTIKYLIEKEARVILMSHLETKDKTFSLKLLIPHLEKLLDKKIQFFPNYLKKDTREKIDLIEPDCVALLENLRFHEGEKKNDKDFAKKISELGDIFVNEAFSSCHRSHASIVGVPNYLPATAGLLLEKEIRVFSNILKKPKRPFVAIIGGIKIETKIKTILNILKVADHLLLSSKMGEVFFAQKKLIVGRDIAEEKLIEQVDIANTKLHLPLDGMIALKDLKENYLRVGGIGTLRKEESVFDIGPESIKSFKEIIRKAKTILWNGPMGMYENKKFEHGTKEIAQAITRNHLALKVAGGGETVSAIKKFNLTKRFDFLSTGGGAMLEFLAGEELPGIKVLH